MHARLGGHYESTEAAGTLSIRGPKEALHGMGGRHNLPRLTAFALLRGAITAAPAIPWDRCLARRTHGQRVKEAVAALERGRLLWTSSLL